MMGESGTERVRLLEADRELAACVGADDLECAQQTTVADIVRLERGVQDPSGVGSHHLLGLLVLDGLMISVLEVAQRRGYELIGPGAGVRRPGRPGRPGARPVSRVRRRRDREPSPPVQGSGAPRRLRTRG